MEKTVKSQITEIGDAFYKKVQERVAAEGTKGFNDIVNGLDEWRHKQLIIGIIGRSGVGKSSFINAFIGKRPGDISAAKVDVVECTSEEAYYPKPGSNLVLVDMPGIGTTKFPRDTYFKQIKWDKNFFILIYSGRVTEDDILIAKTLTNRGIPFFIVRTQVSTDLKNVGMDLEFLGNNLEQADGIVSKIKKDGEDQFHNKTVFVIDSQDLGHPFLEFDQLFESLLTSCSDVEKEVLLFNLKNITQTVIEEKKKLCQQRINVYSLIPATAGVVPLFGSILHVASDTVIIKKAIDFFREQFFMTDGDLKGTATVLNMPVKQLLQRAQIKGIYLLTEVATFTLQVFLNRYAKGKLMSAATKFVPGIIAAPVTYLNTKMALEGYLEEIVEDAKNMNKFVIEKSIYQNNKSKL